MGGDNGSGHYWEARADCLPLIKKLQISGAPNESTSAAQVVLGDATGSGPDGRVLGASRVQGAQGFSGMATVDVRSLPQPLGGSNACYDRPHDSHKERPFVHNKRPQTSHYTSVVGGLHRASAL